MKDDREDGLVDWTNAFLAKDWDSVQKIHNSGVEEARKTMEAIMSTPEQRQMIWNRRKALLDYKSEIEDAEARGEERGEKRGEMKGFDLLGKLVSQLLSMGRIEDAKRVSTDPLYRTKLLKEFELI